jgi:cell division protein FtsB
MKDENLQKYQEKLELIKTHFDIDYLYLTTCEYEREVENKILDLDNNEISNLESKIEYLENEIEDLEAEIDKLKKQLKK